LKFAARMSCKKIYNETVEADKKALELK